MPLVLNDRDGRPITPGDFCAVLEPGARPLAGRVLGERGDRLTVAFYGSTAGMIVREIPPAWARVFPCRSCPCAKAGAPCPCPPCAEGAGLDPFPETIEA